MAWSWNTILTPAEIDAHYAEAARIDPLFATQELGFWETRTKVELQALVDRAWNANERTTYVLAQSYLRLIEQRRGCQ